MENHTVDQDALQSADLARIKQELNEANAYVVKLLSQLEASKQENNELRAKVTEHDQIVEENAVLRQKNADLEAETKTLTDVNKELQEQLEASKQENAGLKRADKKDEFELVEANKKVDILVDSVSYLCAKLEEEQERFKKEAITQAETQTRRFNEILSSLDPSNEQRNDLTDDLFDQFLEKLDNEQYEEALELLLKELMVEESGRNDAAELGLVWNNISACWRQLSSYEKALESAEKAIKYNSTNAIYFYTRGWVHEALGNRAEAIADYKKALELNPNQPCAATALAELQGH